MSFAAMYAGRTPEVRESIQSEAPNNPFQHGGDLGKLTRDYLAAVAELAADDRRLIVETNGHADANTVSLTVRVLTVYT